MFNKHIGTQIIIAVIMFILCSYYSYNIYYPYIIHYIGRYIININIFYICIKVYNVYEVFRRLSKIVGHSNDKNGNISHHPQLCI